jgi:hypothetical protein
METDYISRNEAINRLQEIANDYEDARDMDAFYVADYCLKHIMEIRPAADVRPVPPARWIDFEDGSMCSGCGASHNGVNRNYCPNCVAKMGGTP